MAHAPAPTSALQGSRLRWSCQSKFLVGQQTALSQRFLHGLQICLHSCLASCLEDTQGRKCPLPASSSQLP